MQATRALSHLEQNDQREAVAWAERAARAPGAHVLIAMIAAAIQEVAGDPKRAGDWARNVRSRDPALTREHFFRAFPMREHPVRTSLDAALERLRFE
jgi:hypothetical protein